MSVQQSSMEDILSSIRSSLEEETAKASQPANDAAPDDVLDLSETDIALEDPLAVLNGDASAPASSEAEDLIDLNAFASGGAVKALDAQTALNLDANPATVAEEPAVADVVSAENEQQVVAAQPAVAAASAAGDPFDQLLAELGGDEAEAGESAVPEVPVVAPVAQAAAAAPVVAAAAVNGQRLELSAFKTHQGLQVGLPAEVLAEALRPMVSQWLSENLPAVVERLVRDEIAKLTTQ